MAHRLTSTILAAALAVGVAAHAFAQRIDAPNFQPGPGAYGERHDNPRGGYVGATDKYGYPVRAGAGACIKQCENDTHPCDPIEYKTADARCSQRR
jgi:hypothetical protein